MLTSTAKFTTCAEVASCAKCNQRAKQTRKKNVNNKEGSPAIKPSIGITTIMLLLKHLHLLRALLNKSGPLITHNNCTHHGQLTALPSRATVRCVSTSPRPNSRKLLGENTSYYMASMAVAMFGASFAAVPLYRLYCQATGKGGQAFKEDENKIVNLNVDTSRSITVKFDANTHSSIDWNFSPVQDKVIVHPGETALAFYRVKNPLDEPVIGVATYTVLPYEAGQYFNKIQCFCFEEQMLKPHEDIFMPVLFYIDPAFSKDPQLARFDDVVLSYTFFRSKDGEILELEEPIELKKHGG